LFVGSKKIPDVFLVGAILVLVLAAGEVALACPICFRVEENATTDGALAAVLVLVGVTTVVLGAFARFIVGFVRRESRQSKEPEC
jgi:heme/copper-type cytochrome/quinol oxidase subunit 2